MSPYKLCRCQGLMRQWPHAFNLRIERSNHPMKGMMGLSELQTGGSWWECLSPSCGRREVVG